MMWDKATSANRVKRPTISPLRYPGGKASLYKRLRKLIRLNDLMSCTYVEPYAGGAGAALGLLVTGQVRSIVINDLDPAVYAFWMAATHQSLEFTEMISDAKLMVDEWSRQKNIYKTASREDYLQLGFATFYLNRTNRSGVLNGGPIGGMDQTGNYKIDARFNKATLIERIRLIGLYANQITVLNSDGCSVICQYATRDDVIIYADPPYFDKAGSLYFNSFKEDDHVALAECLNEHSQANWILTYDDASQVSDLYAERRRRSVALNYSAHRVVKAKEIAVFSDSLKIPEGPDGF